MDPTDHTHVPYVVILVRALEDWKKTVRNPAVSHSPRLTLTLAQWKPSTDQRREEGFQSQCFGYASQI